MNKKEQRSICVLYATATCNLKCKYCYIDKSPILMEIDKILVESYNGDYYFNFMKEMFLKHKLQEIQIWGGEPTYGLKRIMYTVQKALDYFPNLNRFMFSTNLTTKTCIDDIFNFYAVTEKHPERQFHIDLQLSLDGPTKINDFNRGEGVTEKFTKNFSKLLIKAKEWLPEHKNVTINAHFKPTLDIAAISELQTKEKIIKYFQFLDEYKKISDSIMDSIENWSFYPAMPNTATPAPHDSKSGKEFANMCKLINQINKENEKEHYFYSYEDVMPFRFRGQEKECYSLCKGCGTCGTGSIVLGLLPNNMISGCHNGFVELLESKKQNYQQKDFQIDISLFSRPKDKNLLIFSKDEYDIYENQMAAFTPDSYFQTVELASLIKQIAYAGQIDSKYSEDREAVNAAHFIQNVTVNCMRDTIGTSGSKYVPQLGYIRLFLNGAKEEILNYE